ncbi:Stigma-specific protein, Stig1 [uncultured archaeon]|nr:Stigma-specific protein, Stig1 [uncultured archaeon]
MEDFGTLKRATKMALLIVLLMVLLIGSAQAWDNIRAHPKINEMAFDKFVKEWMPKDDNLKQASLQDYISEGEACDQDMGIDYGIAATDLPLPVESVTKIWYNYKKEDRKKTIKNWIISGGFSADEPEAPQALRHFYDPEREPHYLTDTINDLPWTYKFNPKISARDWAFNDPTNPYSFPKAKEYFKEAVALHEAPGNSMYGKAWRAVGETMHLISDMTVPAHVRNDCHIPLSVHTRDPFEYHTTDTEVEVYGSGDYSPSNSINYERTYSGQGDLSSLMHDVAKWTNNNFFSMDTLPMEGKTTTANGKEAYPLPAVTWPIKPGYYIGKVDGQDIPLARASLTGIFWKSTQLELDPDVWKAYYKLLIPTAIESSAAVLDAFLPRFEVRIDSIEKDPSDNSQYIVKGGLDLIKTNVWPDPSEIVVRNGATLKVFNTKTAKESDWPLRCPEGGNLNEITWKGQLEPDSDEVTLEYNFGGYVIKSEPYRLEQSDSCQSACLPEESCCNGECIDTYSDSQNCGSCGNICPPGYDCVGASCSKSETASKLVLDHFDVMATKYWNEGEGGTYIILNKTNVSPGEKHFEAENDSSWDSGHFNMRVTTDIDLPNMVPVDNGKYSFNGSIKASASWDSAGLGLSRTAELNINGEDKGREGGIENRQVTLTNQSETTYSGELGNYKEITPGLDVHAITYVERWINPSIEIDVHATYKSQS